MNDQSSQDGPKPPAWAYAVLLVGASIPIACCGGCLMMMPSAAERQQAEANRKAAAEFRDQLKEYRPPTPATTVTQKQASEYRSRPDVRFMDACVDQDLAIPIDADVKGATLVITANGKVDDLETLAWRRAWRQIRSDGKIVVKQRGN